MNLRQPTVEWQVAGACNYDCSYCIQSPAQRRGRPDPAQIDHALNFFGGLPGVWEIKCSGGEAFAHPLFLKQIVPGLIQGSPHRISVLTNLSASQRDLEDFIGICGTRISVFSASLHLEFVQVEDFIKKACWLRDHLPTSSRLVVNQVLLPGRLEDAAHCKALVEAAGLRWFPQLYKAKTGVVAQPQTELLRMLIGDSPGPREANIAPNLKGKRCWAGVDYFAVDRKGDLWSCRSAKRHGEGHLGNLYDGSARLNQHPRACPYDRCPCMVPANRGMIEGFGGNQSREEDL
jgi:hypothetical protein